MKILTKLIDNYKNLSINGDNEYFQQISNLALNIKDNINQYRQKELRNDL